MYIPGSCLCLTRSQDCHLKMVRIYEKLKKSLPLAKDLELREFLNCHDITLYCDEKKTVDERVIQFVFSKNAT